jgi:hypothetical protein
VIEHFKNGDAVPVYRRFRDKGRMMPDGVAYVSSWVTNDLSRCISSWKPTIARCWTPGRRTGATSPRWRCTR